VGAPRVRVSFLLYSSLKDRRSVALTVNDQGLTTLHEGDVVEGIEIVHILADRVEVRYQNDLYTLEVRS
jgi:hypothetical protein